MREAIIYVHSERAGVLIKENSGCFRFAYDENYEGEAVSLTMPISTKVYSFNQFPPFFEGLLEREGTKGGVWIIHYISPKVGE